MLFSGHLQQIASGLLGAARLPVIAAPDGGLRGWVYQTDASLLPPHNEPATAHANGPMLQIESLFMP